MTAQGSQASKSVFERSMPSDLIRGWVPVRDRKHVKPKAYSLTGIQISNPPSPVSGSNLSS
jgi:hypothetical protein